jgi:hypothetical protein
MIHRLTSFMKSQLKDKILCMIYKNRIITIRRNGGSVGGALMHDGQFLAKMIPGKNL